MRRVTSDLHVTLTFLLVAGICLTFNNAQLYTEDDDNCLTPNYQPGQCINIKSCRPIFSLLMKRPLSRETTSFLRQSQCGFEGTFPKICCPNSGESVGRVTSPRPAPTTSNPHRPVSSPLLPDTSQCGLGTSPRIIGGEVAEIDDFPWMVLLEYQKPKGRGFYCGGVLISNRYVLTAAHCVIGKDIPANWKLDSVRLGEYDTAQDVDCVQDKFNSQPFCSERPIDIKIELSIPHENYGPRDANQYHDIALLRLVEIVRFTDFIKPICLPTTQEILSQNYVGTTLYVAGWGKTETRSESNIKLKLRIPVQSNEVCNPLYSGAGVQLIQSQLCAGGQKGRDSCRGDSGGALMSAHNAPNGFVNWYATGIVSFGPSPCGMEGWPGVYTRVSDYMEWIVSNLKS